MIPTIEVNIVSKSNTFLWNCRMLIPDDRDGKVLNREYKLGFTNYGEISENMGIPLGATILKGSVKCHSKSDVLIVLENLKTLIKGNIEKVLEGSYLAIHYCGQVEDDKPVRSCTLEKVWVWGE